MLKILTTDWVEYLFNKVSLRLYENKQERHRKNKESEKNKIIRNNRIQVIVNSDIIYDSKKNKEMSDGLYYALLSYGLMESINSQKRDKKRMICYNIAPDISVMPSPITELSNN